MYALSLAVENSPYPLVVLIIGGANIGHDLELPARLGVKQPPVHILGGDVLTMAPDVPVSVKPSIVKPR